MTRDQKIVAAGAGSGIASMLLLLWLLYGLVPPPADAEEAGDRIAYALRWNALAALPFFAMIVAVGNARFKSEAIDPTAGKESHAMIVDGRVAENTLQQLMLFLIGSLALAAAASGEEVRIVAAAAIVFVLMRTAFWIGYRIRPIYRAFGFSSTIYMNLGLLLGALWFSVR